MRKTILILALGLFMGATVANACDGDTKACKAGKKGSKTCTMTKKDAKACKDMKGCEAKDMKGCDAKAMKDGKMDCCKSKAAAKTAPQKNG